MIVVELLLLAKIVAAGQICWAKVAVRHIIGYCRCGE